MKQSTKKSSKRVFLSRSEVADIYGVDPQTISNYVTKGVLAPAKCSKGHMMFDIQTVNSLRTSVEEIEQCKFKAEQLKAEMNAQNRESTRELETARQAVGLNINKKSNVGSDMLRSMANVALGQSSDRMMEILSRYLSGNSIDQISNEFKLTGSRVLQIINKAVNMISQLRPYDEIVTELEEVKSENARLRIQVKNLQMELTTAANIPSEAMEEINDYDYHMNELLNTTMFDLNISVRTLNGLRALDIETLGDLLCYTPEDLLRIHKFGRKSLNEVQELLETMNLQLDMKAEVERLRKKFMMQTIG